ncbi:MAG: hypothetical protein KF875_07310 [Trueperaceae bacterium]|nr:hypothetical protein [Trueperaceae bacterium]MCO5173583.1 DUF6498-containing protein [Trueperaceae bacterium]MCW5818571.1 hypothetical protein [Trueperaceae bacterium]
MSSTTRRAPANRWALLSLLLANLVPVAGVFLWDWQLGDLVLLYWLESGVVGLYTVAKMLVASTDKLPRSVQLAGKVFGVPFFIAHYGIFWLIHGLFVVVLFGGSGPTIPVRPDTFFFAAVIVTGMRADVLAWPVATMLVSHGASFVTDYLASGEYRRVGVNDLMSQPYGRVVVLHLTIIAGGFLALLIGPSQLVLLLFVAVKVGVDVWAQLRESRAATRTAVGPSAESPPAGGAARTQPETLTPVSRTEP